MYKNKATQAFTLGELMVGIAIIGILAIGVTSIDFNRLSKNQESEIEVVKIMNIIEETKNNAMIGRGVGVNLENPINWAITIDRSASSGSLISQWELQSGATGALSSWETKNPFEITDLYCQTIDGLTNDSSISQATITYIGASGELSGCSNNTFKKLVFDFGLAGRTKEISINAVTGVIEIN